MSLLKYAIYGYSRIRSGIYFAESLPIVMVQKSFKGGAKELPEQTPDRIANIEAEVHTFLIDDAEGFRSGVYPRALLYPESPFDHVKRYSKIFADSIRVGLRRKSKKHGELPKDKGVPISNYPEYFLRNFHFQTDGYLSEFSAELYGHQVEILFKGTAAAMRRMVLRGLEKYKAFPKSILDLASGDGSSTEILARKYSEARVVGVDLSPQYVSYARKRLRRLKNIDFLQGNAEELNFKNESFDTVASTYLMHEVPKEAREKIIKEAHRVLKLGGMFVLADSLQVGDNAKFDWALEQFPIDFHEPFYKSYIQTPLESLLTEAGFEVLGHDLGFMTKVIYARKK